MTQSFLQKFFIRYVPTRIYRALKGAVLRFPKTKNHEEKTIPPASKAFVYGVDKEFQSVGPEFLNYFIQFAA